MTVLIHFLNRDVSHLQFYSKNFKLFLILAIFVLWIYNIS